MNPGICLESVFQDVKVALRVWRKRPLVPVAAILTIALGSGINTALVALIWNVFLTPLPLPDAGRLVQIWVDDGKEERTAPRSTIIEKWRESSRTLTAVASFRPWRVTIASGGEPEQVFGALVSSNFFSTLGKPLLLGSELTESQIALALVLRGSSACDRYRV
jgi:hypothetical protein